MANKPCFGMMPCACGRKIPIFWDGNSRIVCPYCHRKSMSKRQKLKEIRMAKYKHVEKIPAAKVLPVAKGTWITEREQPSNPRQFGSIRATCSRCGAFALNEMVNVGVFHEKLSDFCPSCGADMGEVKVDG